MRDESSNAEAARGGAVRREDRGGDAGSTDVTDAELLAHYIQCGAPECARWNLSPEAAYLDFRLREWARRHLPEMAPLRAVNIGIGAGLWDDWLGYLLEERGELTSVDVDPHCCRLLEARQRREGHPNPARVVCADVLAGTLAGESADFVTMVGSTAREIGDQGAALAAAARLLAPGGRLFYSDFCEHNPPERFAVLAAALDLTVAAAEEDHHLSGHDFYLFVADRR